MRLLEIAAIALSLVAAFAPQNAAVFVLALLLAFAASSVLRWWNGAIGVPLVVTAPLLLSVFPLSFALRFVLIGILDAFLLWFFEDVRARSRGAPITLGRLELYAAVGMFAIAASAFAFATVPSVPSAFLLGIVAAAAAVGVSALRSAAMRARAAPSEATPMRADAFLAGFLIAECFLALTFLPLSPFTLGGALTVCFWAIATTIAHARSATLTQWRAARIGVVAALLLTALFLSVPWLSIA